MSAVKPEQVVQDFIESMRVRAFSPATLVSYRKSLKPFLRWLERRSVRDLRTVTREQVRAYAAQLFSGPIAYASAGKYYYGVYALFAFLEKTDRLLLNPCAGLEPPPRKKSLHRRILTPSEIKKVLAWPDARPKGQRDRALLELLYSTGLRRAELAALCVHDLDLREGFVRVNRGKGGRGRLAPLGASAVEALRAYLPVRAGWMRESPEGNAGASLWLTPWKPHRPLGMESLGILVHRLSVEAGLSRAAGAHAWRHTCATQLVQAGAALPYVQRLLGHRCLTTTQVYTRVSALDVQAMLRAKHPRERMKR